MAKKKASITTTDFLQRTREITLREMKNGHCSEINLLRNTVEELGEYAAAKTVEEGLKNKNLKESSKIEAVDLIICANSLFYAAGGTQEELAAIGMTKLDKWENRLDKKIKKKKKK